MNADYYYWTGLQILFDYFFFFTVTLYTSYFQSRQPFSELFARNFLEAENGKHKLLKHG